LNITNGSIIATYSESKSAYTVYQKLLEINDQKVTWDDTNNCSLCMCQLFDGVAEEEMK